MTKELDEMIKGLRDNLEKLISADISSFHMLGNDMMINSGTINADDIE